MFCLHFAFVAPPHISHRFPTLIMSYCAAATAAHQLLLPATVATKAARAKLCCPVCSLKPTSFLNVAMRCRLGIVVVIVVPFVVAVAVVVTACENNFNCGCHFIN